MKCHTYNMLSADLNIKPFLNKIPYLKLFDGRNRCENNNAK